MPQEKNAHNIARLMKNSPWAASPGLRPATAVSQGPAHSDCTASKPPYNTKASGARRTKYGCRKIAP